MKLRDLLVKIDDIYRVKRRNFLRKIGRAPKNYTLEVHSGYQGNKANIGGK
jgi:hypothetical protein